MRTLSAVFISFVILALPGSLAANIIYTYNSATPITPAGSLPATSESLIGLFPDTVYGNLGPSLNAVNVFAINVMNPLDFSAVSLNGGALYAPDTELFLFDSGGRAVYTNDDISAANTFSCLPSADALNPCPGTSGFGPVTSGTYYLAITRSNQLPFDSLMNYLFMMTVDSTAVVGKDLTAGGANPVAGWDGGAYNSPDFDNSYYAIVLTGTVPEPGSFFLFGGAGVGGLLVRRYRRRVSIQ